MLKKDIALVALLCVCLVANAKEKPFSKFSISPFFSPAITGNFVSKKPAWYTTEPRFGYSAGVLGSYALNKKISFQSGISLSKISFQESRNGNPGLDPSVPITFAENIYHLHYFNIPLQVKYTFLQKKRVSLYAVGGMELNFKVGAKNLFHVEYVDGNEGFYEGKPEYFRGANLSALAGLGIEVALNSRVSWFAELTYRQMLLSIAEYNPKQRSYSFGFTTGVRVKL